MKQLIPLFLTFITFLALTILLLLFIHFLNLLPIQGKIITQLRIVDILVGLTIYLKTSVDFALFIGNLMSTYTGIKNRIAIEIGTALGNAFGTMFVLLIWIFFKEVPVLMVIMIFLAALVLLRLAEDGLEELKISNLKFQIFNKIVKVVNIILHVVNSLFNPLLRFVIPNVSIKSGVRKPFTALLLFSLTIPLLLGLDDFAGYIPLFNIVNIFGFAVGIFAGHMILNAALFASPNLTTKIVRQPLIALLGNIAFIAIALWGFVEITRIILH